mgnify:CR=1 FL=1
MDQAANVAEMQTARFTRSVEQMQTLGGQTQCNPEPVRVVEVDLEEDDL